MKTQMMIAVGTLLCVPFVSWASAREVSSCPLPGQRSMAVAQLFFGLSVRGRSPVSSSEWREFSASALTRYFPDGFTAYDASGQWMDPKAHHIIREPSKVVIVVAKDDTDFAKNVASVVDAYRAEFHQESVGIVTETACASF